jgi:signal peptidase II
MTEAPGDSPSVVSAKPTQGDSHVYYQGGAMRSVAAHLRLWILVVFGLVADLWSKNWAFAELKPNGDPYHFIPGLLDFQLSLNSGALFGMGSGLVWLFIGASMVALVFVMYLFACSHPKQRVIHMALGLILAGALGNLYDRVAHQYDMVTVKATDSHPQYSVLGAHVPGGKNDEGLVRIRSWSATGGDFAYAKSQLLGEVKRVGVVRDFLKITPQVWGKDIWRWVFNVADVFLVVGVSMLLLSFWFQHPIPSSESEHAAAAGH